jgi:hypothetical protein
VFTEFELLEVKVPIIFLGTAGFSHPRDARYLSNFTQYYQHVVLISSELGFYSQLSVLKARLVYIR